jgi:isocitrate dehydrogenase
MLRHLGFMENAAIIENSLLYTLEQGVRTGDFGDRSRPASNTTEFAETIIANFGRVPQQGMKPIVPNQPETLAVCHLDRNAMMVSHEAEEEKIVGVDMFIESIDQPDIIAQKCLHHGGTKFKLINISNRGTQVWPTGSKYTNLVNQYNLRFEALNEQALKQQDIIGLYVSLSADYKICSLEVLNMWGDTRAYSLAQGQ